MKPARSLPESTPESSRIHYGLKKDSGRIQEGLTQDSSMIQEGFTQDSVRVQDLRKNPERIQIDSGKIQAAFKLDPI